MDGQALLVVDVQVDVVEHAVERDRIVGTIAGLVDRARASDTPVVWIQHNDDDLPYDSPGWQLAPELVPDEGEPIIHKQFRDSFDGTELGDVLGGLGATNLVVTGSQSDFCVKSTLHGALARGYNATLVSDGHTTEDLPIDGAPPAQQVMDHLNFYWATQTTPSARGAVVTAANIEFD